MRSALLAAVSTALLATSITPAAAAGAGALDCDVVYETYGGGPTSGSGWCTFYGTSITAGYIRFDANVPVASCPATETASGEFSNTSGSFGFTFDWTRLGDTGLVTASGDINGPGWAIFKNSGVLGCGAQGYSVRVIILLGGW